MADVGPEDDGSSIFDEQDKQYEKPQKAYSNDPYMNSPAARPLRILSEYMEPLERFDHYKVDDTIVIFGSARIKSREDAEGILEEAKAGKGDLEKAKLVLEMSRYYEAARDLSHRLTEWSKGLGAGERRFVVCTGGGPGIMEAGNRGASEAKGINVGLSISLPFEEGYNPYITRELAFQFHYFFMRKFWFAYLAKAVVAMPGGFGTLDELFELLTLVQTRKIRKHMPIVLFGRDYWDEIINFDALVRYGSIDAKDLDLFMRTDSVDEAFQYLTESLSAHALDMPGATL